MNNLRILYHMARADFLERVRRYSFLLVLAATGYLGFAINRGDLYLELDGYRGVLNSAWVGGMMAASSVLLLTLFGFYLVKNTIERDRETGVGQIIATTPISRPMYLLGKWLSNTAVLLTLIIILALAALVMQLLGGESSRLDSWALLAPFLLLALPAMLLVAAIALFFETISWLRGGAGNVIYFFVWLFALISALESKVFWFDWTGLWITWQSMAEALTKVYPGYSGGFNFTEQALPAGGLLTFEWMGIHWTPEILLSRFIWLIVTVVLVLVSSLFFRRFDPAFEKIRKPQKSTSQTLDGMGEVPTSIQHTEHQPVQLSVLVREWPRFSFLQLLAAEIRLLLKGWPWWWYLVALGLVLGTLFSPLETTRAELLPFAWLWPILLWSSLGCRETHHNTRQIVFSTPHPLRWQLPSAWLAGFLFAALMGAGAAVRFLLAGETLSLFSLLAGALFIPSLALVLGVWIGSSKPFEVIYMMLWYIGPFQKTAALDFMGTSTATSWPMFAGLAVVLFIIAVVGRQRQLAD